MALFVGLAHALLGAVVQAFHLGYWDSLGENAGETLLHDYVVRQYTPVGDYRNIAAPQRLLLRPVAATPGHARQINLVVFASQTGRILQALAADC